MNTKATILFLLPLILNFSCSTIEPPDNGDGQDTTSHNFTWQTFTFGEHSSSLLYDVAIINENNIWAVGEIFLDDSSGQPDPHIFNAMHWDGSEWKPLRIAVDYNGNQITPPLYGVYTFSSDDIWFTSGVPVHGDGVNWIQYHLFDMGILGQDDGNLKKIWGSNSEDIYFVGNKGTIAHFKNGNWIKIESGTVLDIYDIWGDYNETNKEYEIIAVAAKQFVTYDKKILRINGNTIQNILADSIPFSIHGLWFKSSEKYFVSGAGLYSKSNINSTSEWDWLHTDVTNYYLYAVRGQNKKDIFACGAFGEVIHYNGGTWKSFINITSITNGAYSNIDFKEDIVVAVGYNNPKAVITIGRR